MPDSELLNEMRQYHNVRFAKVRRWTFGKHEGDDDKRGCYHLGFETSFIPPLPLLMVERDDLVEMAKDILRTLQPSVDDEILASLQRIESRRRSQEEN